MRIRVHPAPILNTGSEGFRLSELLRVTDNGLYCPAGDFYVDPWCPVDRAVITHAHSDHSRYGSRQYICTAEGAGVLRVRVGPDAPIHGTAWGDELRFRDAKVSFVPAGHILGSAQVRVEVAGEVWVVSGDYKTEADRTCRTFEPVRCHTFITESTFGLPIYQWHPQQIVFDQINAWWRGNQAMGKASVLFAYSLGKSQRLIAGVDASIGPIFCHGAVQRMNLEYLAGGIPLPETKPARDVEKGFDWSQALIVAPPSTGGGPYLRRFGAISSAFASGWMRIRGTRRRRALDQGFVLSDHADWPGLQAAIKATGAERVMVTHGYRAPMVRWLSEQGVQAESLETRYEGERDEPEVEAD